jgi:hypothetical protein
VLEFLLTSPVLSISKAWGSMVGLWAMGRLVASTVYRSGSEKDSGGW